MVAEHTTSGTEVQPKLKTTMTTMTPPTASAGGRHHFTSKLRPQAGTLYKDNHDNQDTSDCVSRRKIPFHLKCHFVAHPQKKGYFFSLSGIVMILSEESDVAGWDDHLPKDKLLLFKMAWDEANKASRYSL